MKKIVVILGLAVLHFVATIALIVVSVGMSFERLDAETWTPTAGERVIGTLADAMMFPAYQLWGLLPYPWIGMLEFPFLFLNSLLWSTVFCLAALAVVRRVRRPATEGVPG